MLIPSCLPISYEVTSAQCYLLINISCVLRWKGILLFTLNSVGRIIKFLSCAIFEGIFTMKDNSYAIYNSFTGRDFLFTHFQLNEVCICAGLDFRI